MTRRIFITATDTDAGKTWVTTGAASSWLADGVKLTALKPVACGLNEAGENEDVRALQDVQGLSDADVVSRYRFAMPAAPAQAAAAEGMALEPAELLRWCAGSDADICLIEGIGGLMVPLTDDWLVSDWLEAMPDCEVWLVVGCRLGAINHTLLTLDKLRGMRRVPARVVLNAVGADDGCWLKPTLDAVRPFLPDDCQVDCLGYGEVFVPGAPRH